MRQLRSNSGLSLVIILVAGVVVLLVGQFTMQLVSSSRKAQLRYEVDSDIQSVKQSVTKNRFDCDKTKAPIPAACYYPNPPPVGLTEEFLDVKNSADVVTLSKAYTGASNALGTYRVRAKCPQDPDFADTKRRTIRLEVRRETSSTSNEPARDPASNKLSEWKDLDPLLGCRVLVP